MSHYASHTINPYRVSTGTLARPPSPIRNSHMVSVNPPSPTESTCSSCDSSLPLNTPWSETPTSSMAPVSTHHQHHRHGRPRRQSISDGVRIVGAPPRMSADGRPSPIVIHKQPPVPSPPPTSRSLNAYHAESRSRGTYRSDHSPRTLIVPASSNSDRDRRRRDSISGPLSARTLASHGYTRYYNNSVDIRDDHEGNADGGIGRRGRTRFPRKLVSKEAAEEMGLPWTEDPDGCIVVLQALSRTEIERLVDLTEEIRRRRHSTGKAVSFQEKTIIHEAPPYAPEPPPVSQERIVHHYPTYETTRPRAPLTSDTTAHSSHRISKTVTTTTTTTSPTLGPTGFIGLPGSSQEKLARAEEKAARAEDRAARLEERAGITGRAKDEHEAFKARAKAQEKQRKVEETLLKEKVKMEEREMSGGALRIQRSDGRGNVVVLK